MLNFTSESFSQSFSYKILSLKEEEFSSDSRTVIAQVSNQEVCSVMSPDQPSTRVDGVSSGGRQRNFDELEL